MAEFLQKHKGHHDLIWPCECGNAHYVSITWDDDDSSWRYLSLVDGYRTQNWRQRLTIAWKVLRAQECTNAEVVLSEQNVADLRAMLAKYTQAHTDG